MQLFFLALVTFLVLLHITLSQITKTRCLYKQSTLKVYTGGPQKISSQLHYLHEQNEFSQLSQ